MKLLRIEEVLRERLRRLGPPVERREALELALGWLCAAQDAQNDGGVSHSYLLGQGWMRSYPETTGYIIPSMIHGADHLGDPRLCDRALRMADWELDVQMADGPIPNLVDGSPTVFDTGQVVFGWLAAHRTSGEARYLEAARRAGRWLLSAREDDGVWRHGSDSGGPGRAYNVRVAWALLELADLVDDDDYREPVRVFTDWVLELEEGSSGWLRRNCLVRDDAPLLHTIAYSARGLFECGRLLDDGRLVEASRRTVESLLPKIAGDGSLPGRFRRDWSGAVRWRCLTGMAQLSVLLRRMATHDDHAGAGERGADYRQAATRLNDFLCRVLDARADDPGLRGGVRGSYPLFGAYGQWRVLNWATKFLVDALLIEADEQALVHPG